MKSTHSNIIQGVAAGLLLGTGAHFGGIVGLGAAAFVVSCVGASQVSSEHSRADESIMAQAQRDERAKQRDWRKDDEAEQWTAFVERNGPLELVNERRKR